MSTQIDNIATSFNELLLQTGNVLDALAMDKTTNLILPNSQSTITKQLDASIRQLHDNLDSLLIQLNDISIWEVRLNQKHEPQRSIQQPPQDTDIMSDINEFLAQVPEGDLKFDGELQDNINELLNEDYGNFSTEFDNNIFDEIDGMLNV